MEIIETQGEVPATSTHKPQWLQETISGMNEKTKAILDLLEGDDSLFQNSEVQATRKEAIKEIIKELHKSHSFLAKEFQRSESSSPLNSSSVKNLEALGTLDDSQLENIGLNPESTVEDGDIIECEGIMNDLEYVKMFSEKSITKDGKSVKPKNGWSDGVRCTFSKLVEENTQLQVELLRRNSEKREIILKLQNQTRRLKIENDNLQRTLSYFNRNKQHIKDDSLKKALLIKFFRGCSP